jgi:hypothetical protein
MESLSWQQKSNKSELFEKLNELVSTVVLREMQEVNLKIETLCRMGLIKDEDTLKELRKKMQELKIQGTTNASTNSNNS